MMIMLLLLLLLLIKVDSIKTKQSVMKTATPKKCVHSYHIPDHT